MLRVVDVSVEVGGRLTLVGASFTVQAGDKVGVIGRNGAGKTSMLKVLAGEAEPADGHITRTGALGYLNQDPRRTAHVSEQTALQHVLGGRELDAAAFATGQHAQRQVDAVGGEPESGDDPSHLGLRRIPALALELVH